jgi:hypothetical protein
VAKSVECFCGCGRILTGSDARISRKKGAMVVSLIEALETYSKPMFAEGDHPEVVQARENIEMLISDGYLIKGELAEVVHRERSPTDIDGRGMNSWIKTASKVSMNAMKMMDQEMKRQGIGPYAPQ